MQVEYNPNIRISANSDPVRYALWFAMAETRTLGGTPTPFHQIWEMGSRINTKGDRRSTMQMHNGGIKP